MKWATIGELRHALNTSCLDQSSGVQLACEYNVVRNDGIWLRIDGLDVTENGTIKLTVSLVDEDDIAEEDEASVKILDWAGNETYPGRVFATTQDAWDFLTEDQHQRHPNATEKEFNDIMGEFQTVEATEDE